MFNHRYFGQGYTGQAYFGDGIGDVGLMDPYAVTGYGSYVPSNDSDGMAGYVAISKGSFTRVISSGGQP